MRIIELTPGRRLAIKAGKLIDGTETPVPENITLYIEKQKIRGLSPLSVSLNFPGEITGRLPNHAPDNSAIERQDQYEWIDLSHCTLLPGFIDCHVHMALDGRDFHRSLDRWNDPSALEKQVAKELSATLRQGILAIRDGGDLKGIGLSYRNEAAKGGLTGPLIKSTGWAISKKGKYGSFLGPGYTSEELSGAVKKLAAAGADQIKVLVSGVVSFKQYRKVGELQFTEQELSLIVKLAREAGLKVMAHASSDEAVNLAIKAGVDSIEHGYFISKDSLETMAEAGTAWIPTMAPVASQVKGERRNNYTSEQIEIIEKTYRRQQEMLAVAAAMGVLLGVGTDAGATGVLHGTGYMEELMLYREAGLSEDTILTAATANAADISGFKNMGRIKPGLPACIIAVKGNPLEDLSCLKNIEYIFLPQ